MRRTTTRPRPAALLAATVAVALLLTACGGGSGSDGAGPSDGQERPTIVATTGILGDVTRGVVGDRADVEVLLPEGADPHGFEPSARDVARLQEADLVIANGLGLEEGLEPVLDQLAPDGPPVLEVAPQLAPIPVAGGGDALDPHVWMDPDRMTTAAYLIADAVAGATGLDADALTAGAAAYDERLRAVDEQIQAELAVIPDDRRVLVTNHDSLGYFAERYGFEVVGTVIPGGSTLAEPSAGDLAALAELVAAEGVPAVFADSTVDTGLAETLADETGTDVAVVVLYTGSLGPAGSGAETYLDLLVTDARLVAAALAG